MQKTSTKKQKMRLIDFQKTFSEELKDPRVATEYLDDALQSAIVENDITGFLLALRDVVEALGGIGKISKDLPIHRVAVYKALSENGNPLFATIIQCAETIGIGFKPYIKNRKAFLNYSKS